MGKFLRLKKSLRPKRAEGAAADQTAEPGLVRRMSASSDGSRSEPSESNRSLHGDPQASRPKKPKTRKRLRVRDFFDWTLKNVAYERMSPNNKKRLMYYRALCYAGIALLVVAYTFFVMLLASPIIHIDQGEIKDEVMFVPVTEYLLHSLVPLWKQKAYFVVVVVFIFSISLPFVKMFATIFSMYVTIRHRKKQIELFFGKVVDREAHARFLSGESGSLQSGERPPDSSSFEYALYEDGRLVKYAREILLILKLISKFQMVDVLILMLNIAFLRSAFTWTRAGVGLLYLVVYCLTSILGTQLLNIAVEGERDMFEYWRVVRLLCLPALANAQPTPYHSVNDQADGAEPAAEPQSGEDYQMATARVDSLSDAERMDVMIAMSAHDPSMHYASRASAVDYLSNASSEKNFYELMYLKKKEIRTRWYRSEIFVSVLVLMNVVSAALIMSAEKMFGIAFAPDKGKVLGVDGTQMSLFEIVYALRDVWNYLPMFIYFFLALIVPVVFAVAFLLGLCMYDFFIKNKNYHALSKFDAGRPLANPSMCLLFPVKLTKAIFKFCNILSEWSLGEVLGLGMLAGFISIKTAPNVRLYVPPKKVVSAFIVVCSFGVTSFLLTVQFFMWHTRIISRLSDVTIYIESVNTETEPHSRKDSNESLEDTAETKKFRGGRMQKLEEMIEGAVSDNTPRQARHAHRHAASRFVFRAIDLVRHAMYSKFVISLFFAVLFFVALYLMIFAFLYRFKPTPVQPQQVQQFLEQGMPEVYSIARRAMPKSYGNCNYKVKPPEPCSGTDSIYTLKDAAYFELVWLTGLDSIHFVDTSFRYEDGRMHFKLHLQFDSLRVYVKAGSCVKKCTTLIAGDSICCGDDVHVVYEASALCSDEFPHVRDLRVDGLKLKLTFHDVIARMVGGILDLEKYIERHLVRTLNEAIADQQEVITWRGMGYSIMEFIGFLTKLNFPGGLKCNLG